MTIPGPQLEESEAYRMGNHEYIKSLHDTHGDTVKIVRDGRDVVWVRRAVDVRKVLLSEDDFSKTFDADEYSTDFSQYLMNIMQPLIKAAEVFGSDENSGRRKMLTKVFQAAPQFYPGLIAAIDKQIATWPMDGTMDVLRASHQLVFKAVLVLVMGEDTSYATEFSTVSDEVLAYYEQRYSQPLFERKIDEEDETYMIRLNDAGVALVREFRRRDSENKPRSEMFNRCMLKVLIDAGMDDIELSATMINTLLAASEGPASSLSSTLFELSKNKESQDKLAAELQGKTLPDYEHLMQLDYLSGVVMEGLRLYSPVTLVQREAIRDTEIDGFFIPRGTLCAVCVAAVHHDENQFAQCTRFNPERSGLNLTVLGKQQSFMAFSGGPRGCPGKHLAVSILRLCLARVVQRNSLCQSERPYGNGEQKGLVYKFVEWPVGGLFVDLSGR
eukprot:TRINITY_DN528_c0_g1_i2.p1 TRINITY_DN528_c0_g1~~TRINITY_DN528_c0_g1_i2.p1  ORF type:complete len:443 (-),score=106.24 TRINITY_DN528_c0_g1_i2:65-1393(-)